jgi:hypothetical protein
VFVLRVAANTAVWIIPQSFLLSGKSRSGECRAIRHRRR